MAVDLVGGEIAKMLWFYHAPAQVRWCRISVNLLPELLSLGKTEYRTKLKILTHARYPQAQTIYDLLKHGVESSIACVDTRGALAESHIRAIPLGLLRCGVYYYARRRELATAIFARIAEIDRLICRLHLGYLLTSRLELPPLNETKI
jgi:hypothetical protein